jgi:chromosome segregation ATPase
VTGEHIHIHVHTENLQALLEEMKMKQAELAELLLGLKTQLEKVKTEVQTKLDELATLILNQNTINPEVEVALQALRSVVDGVDALVPDAAAPAPSPAPNPDGLVQEA